MEKVIKILEFNEARETETLAEFLNRMLGEGFEPIHFLETTSPWQHRIVFKKVASE